MLFLVCLTQLVKLINPFLLDPIEERRLRIELLAEVGWVYGTISDIGLTSEESLEESVQPKEDYRNGYGPCNEYLLTCITFVYLRYFQPQDLPFLQ